MHLLLCCSLLHLLSLWWGGGELTAPPPPDVIERVEAQAVVIEFRSPPLSFQPTATGAVQAVVGDYPRAATPGAPTYPYTSTLLALPPGITPRVDVVRLDETPVPLEMELEMEMEIAPAPQGVLRNGRGDPIGGAFAPGEARLAQSPAGQAPIVLEEIGIARGVRLARLTFFPLRQVGDEARFATYAKVRVSWSLGHGETSVTTVSSASAADRMLSLIQHQVRNPQHVVPRWGGSSGRANRSPLAATEVLTLTAFLSAPETGVYQLTFEDVQALGWHDADPHTLRLFQGEHEIAGAWEGDADAAFEAGEALLFYVAPRVSRWLHGDVIRLMQDDAPGLRMQPRSAAPTGLEPSPPWLTRLFEENHLYTPDRFLGDDVPAGRDGERWVWDDLQRAWGATDHISATYPFELPNLDATRSATLTAWLIGYTDVAGRPDHRVALAINGAPLGEAQWAGRRAITVTRAVPAEVLTPGANTLTLRLVAAPGVDLDGIWLDGFAVRYPYAGAISTRTVHFTGERAPHAYTVALSDAAAGVWAFDVTQPRAPRRLTDLQVAGDAVTLGDTGATPARYAVASAGGVRAPAQIRPSAEVWGLDPGPHAGADVIFITPPEFAAALRPLIAWREDQGLSSVMANVQGIYDRWGDGRPAPEAIRAFLAETYATWSPRPTYVALVGDGSFDPLGYRHDPAHNVIPPYLANVDPWAGETAADNRYACVDGPDRLPDLLIGRLPGQTPAEIQAMVAKILAYEGDPLPGGWNANVALVADDADASGDFPASAEAIVPYLTPPLAATRYYCAGADAYASDCAAAEAEAVHAALIGRWQRGALVTQFFGHASWRQWAAERVFHLDDVMDLENHRRWPLVLEMTCFTGAFHRPEPTLDEGLVKAAGGAIAAWGATGLGINTGHEHLARGFAQAIFSDGVEVATVGEATFAGKLALAANGYHQDLLDTFVLLGDPALHIHREIVPWPHAVWLPVVVR